MNSPKETLITLSEILLNDTSNSGERRDSVQAMFELLGNISGVSHVASSPEDEQESILDEGKAISPIDAARCLLDYRRSESFLRGIEAGLHAALARFTERPIQVLYAGTGPYATLITPLLHRFDPDELQITMLDIHPRALAASKAVIEQLGYSDFVSGYVNADATRYQWPADKSLHMVISETMQKALEKEPQVAIVANLARQMVANGILIPEAINVSFAICSKAVGPGEDKQGERKQLQALISVNSQETPQALAPQPPSSLKAIQVEIPELSGERPFYPLLETEIITFAEHRLTENESGLTMPTYLHELGSVKAGQRFEFSYKLGSVPGFSYRQIG